MKNKFAVALGKLKLGTIEKKSKIKLNSAMENLKKAWAKRRLKK